MSYFQIARKIVIDNQVVLLCILILAYSSFAYSYLSAPILCQGLGVAVLSSEAPSFLILQPGQRHTHACHLSTLVPTANSCVPSLVPITPLPTHACHLSTLVPITLMCAISLHWCPSCKRFSMPPLMLCLMTMQSPYDTSPFEVDRLLPH